MKMASSSSGVGVVVSYTACTKEELRAMIRLSWTGLKVLDVYKPIDYHHPSAETMFCRSEAWTEKRDMFKNLPNGCH
jgi:hypothetical protein